VVTAVSGLRGKPTLVNNVETFAHMALIARFGPQWFRAVGAADNPGSMLVTLSGAIANQGVVEVPTGAALADVIAQRGATDPASLRAILVGGYHGTWVPGHALDGTAVSGVGIVHALSAHECGLDRTAMIVEYLAAQSARQCGPCLVGLPRLAHLFGKLASDKAENAHVREIRRVADLVDGRGSCRHPDGTARMIRSALTTFADDIDHHRHKRCEVGVGVKAI
jgi:NADH:ubiquinone oxidoreductase subunit F (NADH-binding)